MASRETYVIVGAGQAGGWAAAALRNEGFDGRVTLLGEEPHPPHERPPLSKALLTGDWTPEKTHLHKPGFLADRHIEFQAGARVTRLEPAMRRLHLAGGQLLGYDRLLLATGARARRLALPGGDLAGVHYLRTIDDARGIRDDLVAGAGVVIVGGGYVGLEVAASARKRGCRVTVIEALGALMQRTAPPAIGRYFADLHRAHGVDIRLGLGIAAFQGSSRVERVLCADGSTILADAVIVGVGALPNAELAQQAGLAVDNGIVTDEFGRTSDPHVFAAGDATNHFNPRLGRRLRLESWQNAQNQAIAAAKAMCGKPVPYAEIPWFWSDQYDRNLQIAGVPERYDSVVLRGAADGDPRTASFLLFALAADRLVAAYAVNNPRDLRTARQFIERGAPVDAARLADPRAPLRDLLSGP